LTSRPQSLPTGQQTHHKTMLVGGAERDGLFRMWAAFAWLSARWLVLVNLVVALTLVGALVAPVLAALGYAAIAAGIHTAYLALCPQRPEHSYFLFGQQLALEQREIAMFAAQLLAGMAFGLQRRDGPALPLAGRWFVILCMPLAWDGLTQLLGLRDSDWFTRTWTGALATLGLVWWAYPALDERVGRADRRGTTLESA